MDYKNYYLNIISILLKHTSSNIHMSQTSQFAYIQNVSFKMENDFAQINKDDIRSQFNGCVTFHSFSSTCDLFTQIHNLMGSNICELINVTYDENTITQSIYVDDDSPVHQKMIILKRKIRHDDSYTFLEFDGSHPENDMYEYDNVTYDDLVNMIYTKYVHIGVVVKSDSTCQNIKYICKNDSDCTSGTIIYTNDSPHALNEIKYLHLINIMQTLKDETKQDEPVIDASTFNSKIEEKLNNLNCTHLYNQHDCGFGTFNCYYPVFGQIKNEVISKLLCDEIYGDVVITFETKLNNDERLLDLPRELFNSILNTVSNPNFTPKNKHYFNIYHELC